MTAQPWAGEGVPMGEANPHPTPKCRCGHDRHHFMVTAEGRYTALTWAALLIGISVRPWAIDYRCRQCNEVFDRSFDPEDLRRHT